MGHLWAYCTKILAQEKKWYPSHKLIHDSVAVSTMAGGVNCDHVSCVRNTPVDGGSEVAAGQSPLSTNVEEISPGNLSVGWEIESGWMYVPGSVVVKGRLKEHISFWKDTVRAPATIVHTIESGYVLPLKSDPTTYVCRNHQAANRNCSFVGSSIP